MIPSSLRSHFGITCSVLRARHAAEHVRVEDFGVPATPDCRSPACGYGRDVLAGICEPRADGPASYLAMRISARWSDWELPVAAASSVNSVASGLGRRV